MLDLKLFKKSNGPKSNDLKKFLDKLESFNFPRNFHDFAINLNKICTLISADFYSILNDSIVPASTSSTSPPYLNYDSTRNVTQDSSSTIIFNIFYLFHRIDILDRIERNLSSKMLQLSQVSSCTCTFNAFASIIDAP